MHFRVRRNLVQLVRTTYDPDTKRPKAQVVGRMPLAEPALTPDLLASLSPEEVREVQVWIDRESRKVLLREELAALTLTETLELADAWLRRQTASPTAAVLASAILPHLISLRKTVNRILE
jgi:hypothetical protein